MEWHGVAVAGVGMRVRCHGVWQCGAPNETVIVPRQCRFGGAGNGAAAKVAWGYGVKVWGNAAGRQGVQCGGGAGGGGGWA